MYQVFILSNTAMSFDILGYSDILFIFIKLIRTLVFCFFIYGAYILARPNSHLVLSYCVLSTPTTDPRKEDYHVE